MKILVAEDDAASRMILGATLKKLGHEVTVVSDGVSALKVFNTTHVPVLITDMVMTNMDGLQLCRRVRESSHAHYTYIILLTTVGGKSGQLVGARAGADDFMTKPFDEELLVGRLTVAARILGLQTRIDMLTTLLPVCPTCNTPRDDARYRQRVQVYLSKLTVSQVAHADCPDCTGLSKSWYAVSPGNNARIPVEELGSVLKAETVT